MYISAYNNDIEARLARAESQQLEEITVDFSPDKNFDLADIIKLGDFINTRRGLQRIYVILKSSKNDFFSDDSDTIVCALASLLLQTIKHYVHEESVTVSVLTAARTPLGQTPTFLRSSKSIISCLTINSSHKFEGLHPEESSDLATAVASLENLKSLHFKCSYGSNSVINPQILQDVLLECAHQSKFSLEKLSVEDACGFQGLTAFLPSQCASSSLKELKLKINRLNRMDAIELKLGLMLNNSITKLSLKFGHMQEDFKMEGLPILLEYLKAESSIGSIELIPWMYHTDEQSPMITGPALSALESKTSLTNILLDRAFDFEGDGKALPRFLVATQWLQSLQLIVWGSNIESQQFRQNLADGLRSNRSLRSFHLELSNPEHYGSDSPLDVSTIIDTLSNRDGPNQLEKVKLEFGAVTPSTWVSLTKLLQRPESPLVSIDVRFDEGVEENVLPMVGAVKSNPVLKQVVLWLSGGDEVDSFDSKAIYASFLSSASSSLTGLSIELWDEAYEDMDDEAVEEGKAELLKCMEANTHLESVELSPWSGDEHEFIMGLKLFCSRNKALNAAKGLEDGSLAPAALPSILSDIEKDYYVLGEPTDVPFVNVWFSLIRSRPLQAERFCCP